MPLSPDCLAKLKLQHAPFDALPSEDFVYTDEVLDEFIASSGQELAAPAAILMLTGESGSGRSMQLMRLLGSLPENFELIAFRARLTTQFEAVDFTLRNHLRDGGHDDPDRALTDLLADRVRAGQDPVIAVDDAHLLGMDIINILLRMRSEILETEGRAPRLVLAGDPVLLRRRLNLRPADEDRIARFSLRPFSLEQSGAYLHHRLRAAGLAEPESLLTRDDIGDLQAESKGLPAALNAQANAWLEDQCRTRAQKPVNTPFTLEGAIASAEAFAAADRTRGIQGIRSETRPDLIPTRPPTSRSDSPPSPPSPDNPKSLESPETPTAPEAPRFHERPGDHEAPGAPLTGPVAQQDVPAEPEFGEEAPIGREPDANPTAEPAADGNGPTTDNESEDRSAPKTSPGPAWRAANASIAARTTTVDTPARRTAADGTDPAHFEPAPAPHPGTPPGTPPGTTEPEEHGAEAPFWNRPWFVPVVATTVAVLILAPFAGSLFERSPPPEGHTVELPLPRTAPPGAAPRADVEPDGRPAVGDSELVTVPFDPRAPAPTAPAEAAPEVATAPAAPPPAPPAAAPSLSEPPPRPADTPARTPADAPTPAEAPLPTPSTEPSVAPPATSAPQAQAPVETAPAPIEAAPAAPAPTPAAPSTTATPAEPTGTLAADRRWLSGQNPSHTTIQLIAAPNLTSAQDYATRHALGGVRYIETRSGGRDFVVILAGSFATRAAAEAAAGDLPEAVRANEPWLRSIGSVQGIQR